MNITTPPECPLCPSNNLLKEKVIAESDDAYLIKAYSNPGNFLIIPIIHTESLLTLPDNWWQSVKALLSQVPELDEHFNMSINIGQLAGQSVKHVHFWVIPRQAGRPSSGKGFARLIDEADKVEH